VSVNVPRRLWFWILAAAFAWAMFFWVTHVPYRPDRLFRAIPANSAWISVHDGLAARWAGLSGNPLIMTVLNACGIDLETQAMLAADKDFQSWLRIARSRPLFLLFSVRGSRHGWSPAGWGGTVSGCAGCSPGPGSTRAGVRAAIRAAFFGLWIPGMDGLRFVLLSLRVG